VEVGSKIPPFHTTSGILLLAYMDAESQRLLLEHESRYVKMSRAEKAAIQTKFKKIRKQGWYFAPSSRRTGLDLSCLVGNPGLGIAAGLAVPFLAGGRHERKERQALSAVMECARQITASLGLTSPLKPAGR
jgi:DNA-binding IclR family transcriptional regulator